MTFDTVHNLLLWFFNRQWQVSDAPRIPGNHDMIHVQWSKRHIDVMDVWETTYRIEQVIMGLSTRNREILRDLFTYEGRTPRQLARHWRITERRIRQIRRSAIDTIEARCEQAGLIKRGKYDELRYA